MQWAVRAAKNPELWNLNDYTEDMFNGKDTQTKIWMCGQQMLTERQAPSWKALFGNAWAEERRMLPELLRTRVRDGGPQPHTRVHLHPGSRPQHKEDGRGGRRAEGGRRQQTEERSAGRMSEPSASAKAKTKAKATTKAAINKDNNRVDSKRLSITKDPGTNMKFRTRKKLVWQGYRLHQHELQVLTFLS